MKEILEDLFCMGFSLHFSKEMTMARITVKDDETNISASQMLPRDHHLSDSLAGAIKHCTDKVISMLTARNESQNDKIE